MPKEIDYSDFVVITTNARTMRVITDAQRMKVSHFAQSYAGNDVEAPATRLVVNPGGFDLPEGYITCAIYREDELMVYYGISAEGDASS